ncbi:hypothetical protein P261_01746 [Lachnospiraceae bacterium TWA4]|nr:hypothetical protein P261_01746 [Lachnospiraceae bacterium TWA4]
MFGITDFIEKNFQLSIPYIRVIDIIEIFIITILIYNVILWLRNTKAWNLLKGILVLFVCYVVASSLGMTVIVWLVNNSLSVVVVALVIVFQPELRQALDRIGNLSKTGRLATFLPFEIFNQAEREKDPFNRETAMEILNATFAMAAVKTGALIVIQQSIELKNYVQRWGTDIDAIVSSDLLINIFEKDTPLHDGAVIIVDNRIVSAKCFLPLNEIAGISDHLGTRHHAAAGISEITDSITIIVSEQTGQVSVAKNGRIMTHLNRKALEKELLSLCKKEELKEKSKKNWKLSIRKSGKNEGKDIVDEDEET